MLWPAYEKSALWLPWRWGTGIDLESGQSKLSGVADVLLSLRCGSDVGDFIHQTLKICALQ